MHTIRAALVACTTLITGCATMHDPSAADVNMSLGLAYLSHGFPNTAHEKLVMATEQAPDNPKTWDALAYYYEKTNKLSLAKQTYQHALNLAPHSGAAHTNYGNFLCRQGKYKQALAMYTDAIDNNSYDHPALAYHDAAVCAEKHGDYAKADHYNQLAEQAD